MKNHSMRNHSNTDQFEMVMLVFKIRKLRLLQSAPQEAMKSFEQMRLFDVVEEKLQSIPQYTCQQQLFYIDLFCQMSRIREGYCVNKDGKPRFQFYQKRWLKDRIILHFKNYVSLFKGPIKLSNFDDQKNLQNAKINLIENIRNLKFIYQQTITIDQIDRFFNQLVMIRIVDVLVQHFAFCAQTSTRVYVQYFSHACQVTLEAVLVESLYYWLLKNKDPLIILSEGQKRFYINKDLYEPGDYYKAVAYNIEIHFPSPFRMLMQDLKCF